jgi:3-deoxy-7-phosphoheptulonate synthase
MHPAFIAPALPLGARRQPLSTRAASTRRVAASPRCVAAPLAAATTGWTPSSWRGKKYVSAPKYADETALEAATARLRRALPLVFSGEVATLTRDLARVAAGEAHVLQGGECAERFGDYEARGGEGLRDTFVLLIQMSLLMMYGMRRPVVKILRGAGQFTKNMEDVRLAAGEGEVYRGDLVNGVEAGERAPDPWRMVKGHQQATAVINMLRTAASGGQFDLHRIHDINLQFVRGTDQGLRFVEEADQIAAAIAFMESVGMRTNNRVIEKAEFYTSHECLLLEYEEALVRMDPKTGEAYATSAHFLWVGNQTRAVDGAHVEFLSGIANPVGVKVGPSMTGDELVAVIRKLNPRGVPGKVSVMTRLGAGLCAEQLPGLIAAVASAGDLAPVVWLCDPCHGNTERTASGIKTRRFAAIVQEVGEFFAAHESAGTHPGGVHLEITGDDVIECTGGMMEVDETQLSGGETQGDPRLNASQALELAFVVSESMKNRCRL